MQHTKTFLYFFVKNTSITIATNHAYILSKFARKLNSPKNQGWPLEVKHKLFFILLKKTSSLAIWAGLYFQAQLGYWLKPVTGSASRRPA
jgi:hypothetical protein